MDSRQDYQPFTPKSNGKLPEFSTENYRDNLLDETEEEKLDLSWLLGVLRRRFLVMAAATIALSTLAGTAIVVTSKSITLDYEGSFSLLVEPATAEGLLSKQLNNTLAADLARINIEWISLVDYETQIRILRSPKMMQPVIQELWAWYPNMNYSTDIKKVDQPRHLRERWQTAKHKNLTSSLQRFRSQKNLRRLG